MDSVCQLCCGNDFIKFENEIISCPICVQTEPTEEIPNETKSV